ncbi:agmatine deiminase family protein [Streptomyces boncukensis]|nr:agmatine deiminase family protein [Streptomyces boncukensis]
MPPETAPQERVWTAFPPRAPYAGEEPGTLEEARRAWTRVALAIARFEPVTMLAEPADLDAARRLLSGDAGGAGASGAGAAPRRVSLLPAPLDDAWMRDIGPTFVLDEDGRLGSVEWVFNGWGRQEWAAWEKDARVGRRVGDLAGAVSVRSPLVNEGGGIHVDGLGTVLVTETVQLDPHRNPGLDRAAVEAELARTIGAEHVIWLPRGLTRDAERYGTRGHVDLLATIPSPGRLLVHVQPDPAHPDHAVTRDILDVLRASTDARGNPWEITELPAPKTLSDEEGWVGYSYINHLVVNGAVIACGFEDPNDEQARRILADAYPGREVVMLDARTVFAGGGGIHCITQQQPRTPGGEEPGGHASDARRA